MKRYLTATGFILLLFITAFAMAKPTDRYEEITGEQDDFDVIEKPWLESGIQVPELPNDAAWSPVPMDSLPKTQQLALDKNTMKVDQKDWVVRYWVLIRSTGGAYNAAYEGIRCTTNEFIIYAYGQNKREPNVKRVREPRWMDVGQRRKGNYRRELVDYFFCAGEVPRNIKQIEQAIDGVFELMNPYEEITDDY